MIQTIIPRGTCVILFLSPGRTSCVIEFKGKSILPIVKVVPRRNHPEIVAYNRVMLSMWGANCDLKIIFDPDRIIHYALKYTMKEDTSAEVSKALRSVHNANDLQMNQLVKF